MKYPLLLLASLFFMPASGAESFHARFDTRRSEVQWPVQELNPVLPRDWSHHQFLTLELRSSTEQRFELRLHTNQGQRSVRLVPFPNVWVRVSVPLAYFQHLNHEGFDLASLANKPTPGCLINIHGDQGPITDVVGLGVSMPEPVGHPSLELRAVRLENQNSGNAVLTSSPLVDEFGQWQQAEWQGKAKTLDDLKRAWNEESKALRQGTFHFDAFGGFSNTTAKATGFFRVEQIKGRWWFIDPAGHWFFSTGCDGFSCSQPTYTGERNGVFALLPPNTGPFISFYTGNLIRRFGQNYETSWIDLTFRRMEAWGFNTLGNWSDSLLCQTGRKPYVLMLDGWGVEDSPYLGLPDVFAENFAARVDAAAAQQCDPHKNDPWLLGYFIANEPPWPGHELEITTAILQGPPSATRHELESALAGHDTPERRMEFVNCCIERFLDIINAAVRRHDPHHLNLGLRFGSRAPEAMLRAARGFDVFSLNSYAAEVDRDRLKAAYRITGKPVLIGEFHFGTPGRGMSAGLVQCADQRQRGVAYRHYVESAAAAPMVVGAHWFEWIDQPNTGRPDGENYNIGFIDVTDRPYPELVEAAATTHARLLGLHSGTLRPLHQRARTR